MLRIGLLFLGLFGLTACGSGPTSIMGRVVDHQGTAVSKAEVVSEPQTDLVVTNSKGFFILQQRINELGESTEIPAGVYQIIVRKFGYQELIVNAKADGGPLKLPDLMLQPRTPDIGDSAPQVLEDDERAPDEMSVPNTGI